MIVKTLSECINSADLFDTIFLRNSYGRDFIFFHYNSLGLGNLLVGHAGAHSIIQLSEPKKILSFPKNRIQAKLVFYRNPLRWLARSEFGIDKLGDLYNRYLLLKQIKQDYSDSSVSFIDKKNKVLYLSTHMVNDDSNYIKIVLKNISTLKNDKVLMRHFNVDFSKGASKKNPTHVLNIGLHLRRGDFLVSNTNEIDANSSPSIEAVIEVLNLFKNCKNANVAIYSDQSKKITKDIIKNHLPKFFNYKVFNPMAKGASVINDMVLNDVLIQSNSTLSTWSGMISGQVSPFIGDGTPWKVHSELNNFVRSDGNFSHDLVAIINSKFDSKNLADKA